MNVKFRELGLTYFKAINLMKKVGFSFNRKGITGLAIRKPEEFTKIIWISASS
ncbi:50S ribosomal protein L20 [Mycoplasma ovis str. Michigan]|uniref:50S ribosomal protein L20 n=1 Tax=Mycoplasma ovis str. Michigan TaxID=1415773 RepID=A0ABM5P0S2_9MOLU|nr:50S ribosomal protein L20 [Mycoplasma ovis str. Michigan]